jgi:hypothetical protein
MQDANHLRDLARRCRALSKTAMEPEVIEQLRLWVVDFLNEADDVERRAGERDEAETPAASAIFAYRVRTEPVKNNLHWAARFW